MHKTRTPLTKWFWMIWLKGRQKSGISMLCLQRMLEIKTYKTVWTMGHKIRKAMAERDAYYQLPGKRGRGAAGKAKVVVAVETRGDKPRFAKMRQVPTVSGPEIVSHWEDCLKEEAVVRTDGWPVYRALASGTRQMNPR